jgi:hypothetical protein
LSQTFTSDRSILSYSVSIARKRGYMHVYRTPSTLRTVLAIAALAAALSVTGCKKASSPANDATLTTALQSRIAGDGALSSEPIQASVQNSVATLNGTVSSQAARSLAAADAAQVPGIKTVVNNLTVEQPAPVVTAAAPPPAAVQPKVQAPPPPRKASPYRTKPAPVVRQNAPIEPAVQQAETAPSPPMQQAAPPPPPPPPAPTFREVTIGSGSVIPVRITQTLDSATTQQGETFTGTLASDIVIDGVVALRQGTSITGRVSDVQEAAHYKGSSLLTIELTSINRRGANLAVSAEPYTVQGKGRGKNTAEKVGGGAAVGAILGGILGGGKGAAIGAAAGGGVGAGANTITRGEQVQIPSESVVRFHLTNPIALRVSTKETESTTSSPELQPRPNDQPPQ